MIKDKYTEAPPGPRTTLDQGVHFLKRTVGPAHVLHFATRYMGREGLDCVFSNNICEGEGHRTQAVQLQEERNNTGLFTYAHNCTVNS